MEKPENGTVQEKRRACSFCGLAVENDPLVKGAFCIAGRRQDEYGAFAASLREYEYVRYGAPVFREADPEEIHGILLDKASMDDPAMFWSQHRPGGTMESFVCIARGILSVRAALEAGAPLEDLSADPELGKCAGLYFDQSRPDALELVDVGPGRFLWFQSNGRHRVLAARLAGYRLPVKITGAMSRKKGWDTMKLKHWQGYGTVDAKRMANTENADGTKTLHISVTGLHECGLVRNDTYDVHRWLVRRFARDCPDYRCITGLAVDESDGGRSADYFVTYRPRA